MMDPFHRLKKWFFSLFTLQKSSYVGSHSFKTQPGDRPGLMIASRVRWVDPGQPKKNNYNTLSDRKIYCLVTFCFKVIFLSTTINPPPPLQILHYLLKSSTKNSKKL
uniref:Uncharacterized protein n=1 Tax=Populus trichocarpa TaxID=3694 RepID=A0A2K1Z9V5_POPTR